MRAERAFRSCCEWLPGCSCEQDIMVHTARSRINGEVRMRAKAQNLVLTESQAACLIAVRHRKVSQPKIAVEAKRNLRKTAASLRELARLALAKKGQTKKWHPTARGESAQ